MNIDNELVRRAVDALKGRHGQVELSHRNNQFSALLPDGRRARIKSGRKGQVMQGAHGTDVNASLIGLGDVELAVVAVQNGPGAPIGVYEVPADIYQDQMKLTYRKLIHERKLEPSDLRVLRFDNKGYLEQRVAENWAKYRIDVSGEDLPAAMRPREEAVATAKAIIAEAFDVPVDKVSISVNM